MKIKNVFSSVQLILFISFFTITIIELYFKNIDAPLKLFYTIGNIILNVCYSIIAASIFYYVNQYLPKENKIVKSSRYITLRMRYFHYEIQNFQQILKLQIRNKSENLTDEIKFRCSQINPNEKIQNNNNSGQIFQNWYEFLEFKLSKLIFFVDDILPFYEGMNDDLFESLLNLKDSIRLMQYKLEKSPRNLENLTFLSDEFENLFENHLRSNKIIRVKYKKYLDESDYKQEIENGIRDEEKKNIQIEREKKLEENLKKINQLK